MGAAHNASSLGATERLRRYVLDSLAVGRAVDIHCSDSASLRGLIDLGTRFSAQPRITPRACGWDVRIEPNASHFELYNLH